MSNNNIYPLSAEEITALYDGHELMLSAKGESQPITSNIRFVRLPWLGGLKFELQGRILPVMGSPKSYTVEDKFKMPAPASANVIVVYEGYPQGKPIPIRFTGLKPTKIGDGIESLPKDEPPKPSQSLDAENEKITIINGHTFKIQVPSEVPKFGSITMDHDREYLELQTAGIQDKDICWTFQALQPTPDTQIQLFVAGGIANYVYRKVYDVFIGLADEPVVELVNAEKLPTFSERVGKGINKIKEKYSDAKLHDVLARPPVPIQCENPAQLSSLTVSCEVDDGKLIASVSTWGYSTFGPIYIHEKLLDDRRAMDWPLSMDAIKADELMKAQGWKGPYTGLTLCFSSLPNVKMEPHYIFDMVMMPGGARQVLVGVNTGTVTANGQVLPPKNA